MFKLFSIFVIPIAIIECPVHSIIRCSDNFYDMNIEFLKEVMKDYDSNDYKYGKFLNEHG